MHLQTKMTRPTKSVTHLGHLWDSAAGNDGAKMSMKCANAGTCISCTHAVAVTSGHQISLAANAHTFTWQIQGDHEACKSRHMHIQHAWALPMYHVAPQQI